MAIASKLKLDKSGGVDIKPDSYIGLLLAVVHLGPQRNTYQGVTTIKDQLALQFELQDLLFDSGNPITVTKIETNSMKNKANLVKFGKAIRANLEEGIDFEELISKPVLVNMDFNEAKTRVVIKSFTPLPSKDLKDVKPLIGTPKVLLDVDEITESQRKELPEWIGKLIAERVRDAEEHSPSSSSSVDL